ncbi:MAG: hypothetical protein ACRBC3_00490 [Burkholderiaceae bacterium]
MESMPRFEYQRFETRTDARSAFDTAIEMAQRTIQLYDRDGDFYGLDRPIVAEHFNQLLRRNPQTTIVLVLQHAHHLRRDCPRLLELMQVHGDRLEVRRLDDKARGFERSYLLIDKSLVMRRPHFDRMVTFWDVDEQEINATDRLFTDLIENSPERISANVAGL